MKKLTAAWQTPSPAGAAGPAVRLRSTFIGGIKHLPVRFTPA